jgi:hypothetical protein
VSEPNGKQEKETITIGGRTFTVLFPDLIRPLTAAELGGLREDVAANGIQVAVVIDQDDGIIDGINRLRIAAELGTLLNQIPFEVCCGLTVEQKQQKAVALNVHRRHLQMPELMELRARRVERVAVKRAEGKSLRAIALEEGVSAEQVRQDVKEAGVKGLTPEPEANQVTGLDGKKWSATRPRPPKPAPQSRPQAEAAPPPPAGEKPRKEKLHKRFDRCLRLARERKNILLIGPAGCGKTVLAEQVADALSLEFAHVSCSAGTSDGTLLGRLLPTGEGGRFEYHPSEFVRLYEQGGVFLFDEIDAADANVLIVVNAALANDRLAVPSRIGRPVAVRHPDFVAVAAANTYGTGADRLYVGRNQLDEATLDRFRIGQIELDYDPAIEKRVCPDPHLRGVLQTYRKRARKAGLRRIISTRFLRDAYDML